MSMSGASATASPSDGPFKLSLELLRKLDDARAVKPPPGEARLALQIATLQARVWSADDDDTVCRPWYILCLELYPRGKVINHVLSRPISRPPSVSAFLSFLLDQIARPPDGDLPQRPTHVSFVDPLVTAALAPHLARIRIICDTLTLADGVSDYMKKFADKLVQTQRATRGDAAERPGLLNAPGITEPVVRSLMKAATAMHRAAPWIQTPEHVALNVRLPPAPGDIYRERYFLTVLGSDRKAFGFALVPSLHMLRSKFRRVIFKRTGVSPTLDDGGEDDSDNNDSDNVGSTAGSDLHVCAACGRRVGDDDSDEVWVNRCTGCHNLLYCDETCQRTDWRLRHRNECKEAAATNQYVYRREEWRWMDRELALLFVDPTSVPFDDLDAFQAHAWPFAHKVSPPLYPMPFVSVQLPDGVSSRRDLPTAREMQIMTRVAEGLVECNATPPAESVVHLDNGVSLSLAENLAESIPVM